jgi:uncharacterized membrane protein
MDRNILQFSLSSILEKTNILMSSSDLVSMFLAIEFQICGSLSVVSLFGIDPTLLCAILPIKSYSIVEADKAKIIKDNKDKSGIYM